MSTFKDIYTGHDYHKVGIVKDGRMNPLSAAQRATLATTLGAGNIGLLTTDDVTGLLYTWNGTAFVFAVTAAQSGLTPKGNVAFNATEPVAPTLGDLYIFSSAGNNTWGGSSNVVQASDQVWWDGAAWQYIQGNVVQSSAAVQGILQLATQTEVNAGTDANKAVTPATLLSVQSARKLARVYFTSSVTTVADTPLTINHALALQNRDAFTLSFKVGFSEVEVDVDSTDINNCTITSSVALTGSVTIIGF